MTRSPRRSCLLAVRPLSCTQSWCSRSLELLKDFKMMCIAAKTRCSIKDCPIWMINPSVKWTKFTSVCCTLSVRKPDQIEQGERIEKPLRGRLVWLRCTAVAVTWGNLDLLEPLEPSSSLSVSADLPDHPPHLTNEMSVLSVSANQRPALPDQRRWRWRRTWGCWGTASWWLTTGDQLETSIQVTWPVRTNQRPVLPGDDVTGPGDKMLLRCDPGCHHYYIPWHVIITLLLLLRCSYQISLRYYNRDLAANITPWLTSDIRLAIILLPTCNLSIECSFLSEHELLWKDAYIKF